MPLLLRSKPSGLKTAWEEEVATKICLTCGKKYSVPSSREHKTKFCSRACNRFKNQLKHNKSHSKIYQVWTAIKRRCHKKTDTAFKFYGARGIYLCDRWHDFANFYADMGDAPFLGAQIDRIDNNGPYAPDNCRWVSRKQNMQNTRRSRYVVLNGETMTFSEACSRLGVSRETGFARKRRLGGHQIAIQSIIENPPVPRLATRNTPRMHQAFQSSRSAYDKSQPR